MPKICSSTFLNEDTGDTTESHFLIFGLELILVLSTTTNAVVLPTCHPTKRFEKNARSVVTCICDGYDVNTPLWGTLPTPMIAIYARQRPMLELSRRRVEWSKSVKRFHSVRRNFRTFRVLVPCVYIHGNFVDISTRTLQFQFRLVRRHLDRQVQRQLHRREYR